MNKTVRLILNVLNKKPDGMSVADIIIETGFSYKKVIKNIDTVSKLDFIQFKVTESGNILYYIDDKHHYKNSSAFNLQPGFLETAVSILLNSSKFLFKVFFSVILSLYFFLLYGIILLLSFLSTVNKHKIKNTRTLRIGLLDSISGVIRLLIETINLKRPAEEKNNEQEIVHFILKNKGVITLPELAAFTGSTMEQANQIINNLLLQYSGEPFITKTGTLVFQFPLLLENYSSKNLPLRSESKYNYKKSKSAVGTGKNTFHHGGQGRTILIYFTLFNIFFGLYFILSFFPSNLIYIQTVTQPINLLIFFLGTLPLLISVIYFVINVIYSIIHSALSENTKREYLRKLIYFNVLETPDSISTALFPLINLDEFPKNAGKFIRSTLDELAVLYGGEIDALDGNNYVYHFKELNRHIMDVSRFRRSVDASRYSFGKTIFDSGV